MASARNKGESVSFWHGPSKDAAKSAVLIAIAALACQSTLLAKFGETKNVPVYGVNPVPEGWVIIGTGQAADGLTSSGDRYYHILDLNGAPYQTSAIVKRGSKIPSGWVIIGTDKINTINPNSTPEEITILCLNGAPRGTIVKVLQSAGSPIPAGWRKIEMPKEETKVAPGMVEETKGVGGIIKVIPSTNLFCTIKKD
jgi:uncharacterized protein YbdZ (MbtH family)